MKKPSIATQLRTVKAENEKLITEYLRLEKELKSTQGQKDSYWKSYQEKEGEIEQIHQILDAVPNSVARKGDSTNEYSLHGVDRKAATRLAAWLAAR